MAKKYSERSALFRAFFKEFPKEQYENPNTYAAPPAPYAQNAENWVPPYVGSAEEIVRGYNEAQSTNYSISEEHYNPAPHVAAEPTPLVASFCTECGERANEYSVFCSNCGKRLE